jgi:predicted transcriptional regulator of viral defense system
MTQFERIDHLFETHGGIVKTSQVIANGIAKPTFYAYMKERCLQQAAHGVFISPDSWMDGMYLLHLRCGQAVFSHETALYFHDLTDREPCPYSITVKTGYNPSTLKSDGVQVYTIKRELHNVGIITLPTSFGHPVPVYDMERTICDIVRSRNNIEAQTFHDALKQYAHRRDKNLRLLMHYAALFRVEKILRQYLEVLL